MISGWFNGDTQVCETLVYTFTINEDTVLTARYEARGSATVTVNKLNGADYSASGDELTQNGDTLTIALGKTLTLTALDADSFLQWQNGSGKVLGRSPTLSLTVTGNMDVELVYKSAETSSSFVQFVSDYGQIMLAGTYSKTDTIPTPDTPTKFGYTFVRWVFDGTRL